MSQSDDSEGNNTLHQRRIGRRIRDTVTAAGIGIALVAVPSVSQSATSNHHHRHAHNSVNMHLLLEAIKSVETGGNDDPNHSVSSRHGRAIGAYQIQVPTAKDVVRWHNEDVEKGIINGPEWKGPHWHITKEKLENPNFSAIIAREMLRHYIAKGNLHSALLKYNNSESYVSKVMHKYHELLEHDGRHHKPEHAR